MIGRLGWLSAEGDVELIPDVPGRWWFSLLF
jgi:hypothetical protein